MEKSIENIWKDGFLDKNALVAPKLNNLYNQKSKDIIAKLLRMLKINLIAIVIGSIIVLSFCLFAGIPIMGIGMFVILNILVLINLKQSKSLKDINKNVSSYEYLRSFNTWLKKQMSISTKAYRFAYPLLFLCIILGFWFKEQGDTILGEVFTNKLLEDFPNLSITYGMPTFLFIGIILFVGLAGIFGDKLYHLDLKLAGYTSVFRKIEELLHDMEELKS